MENELPTLLGRHGNASPVVFEKKHFTSALGMAADRKKPVVADGCIRPMMSRKLRSLSLINPLECSEKKYNQDEQCHGPFTTSSQMPRDPMRRELSGSWSQGQKEKKATFNPIKGPQFRRRSLSTTHGEQSSFFVRQRRKSWSPGLGVENSIAQTSKAEQKFQDERTWKQLPPATKLMVTAKQPALDNYEKFKQRRATSKELNCPLDTAKDAQRLFDCYAYDDVLSYKNFRDIVVEMLKSAGQECSPVEMEKKIQVSWREVDRKFKGKVNFDEFAIWYSSWSFQQELLLSPTKILIRDFARKYNLSIADVDSVHSMFEYFDEDDSGEIEFHEFQKLLYKLMKIPKDVELPTPRLQRFWKEIDIDGSGSVCFAEFLQWYIKYFDMTGIVNTSPMEQFYSSVRPSLGRC